MIAMYSIAAISKGWWENINIIIWGGSAKLISEDAEIEEYVKKMIKAGIKVEGCLSCSEQLGVTEQLRAIGVDLKYMGEPLTGYLKNDEKVLSL